MGILGKVFNAYADPRASMARRIAARPRESLLLVLIVLVSLVGFFAGIPSAVRQAAAFGDDGVLPGILAGRLMAALFATPLFVYALAALSHLVARLAGGQGYFWTSRLALVWALVLSLPFSVLGSILPSAFAIATVLPFLWYWAACLSQAHAFASTWRTFVILVAFSLLIIGGIALYLPV